MSAPDMGRQALEGSESHGETRGGVLAVGRQVSRDRQRARTTEPRFRGIEGHRVTERSRRGSEEVTSWGILWMSLDLDGS